MWRGNHTIAAADRFGGLLLGHKDGTEAYIQPGDDANALMAALEACGGDLENIDGLICDYLPD